MTTGGMSPNAISADVRSVGIESSVWSLSAPPAEMMSSGAELPNATSVAPAIECGSRHCSQSLSSAGHRYSSQSFAMPMNW